MRISINVVFALVALGGFLLPQAAQGQITLNFTVSGSDQNRATPILDLREGQTFTVTVTATGAIPAGGFISAVITGADADINTPTGSFTANGRTGIRFNLSASRMSHAQTWTITDDMAREGTESKTLHLYHDAFITAGLGGTTVSVSLTPGSLGANRSRQRTFNIQESDESVLTPQISTSPAQAFGEGEGNVRFDIVLASGGASLNAGLFNVCWYVTFSDTQTATAADFSGLTTLPTRTNNTCSGRANGGLVNAAGTAGQVSTAVATTVTSTNFFRVLLADDSLIEAAETLTLHLGGPTTDPGISYGSVDLAIADNDGYTLTPVPPAAPVQEGSAPTWRVRYTVDEGSRALASETTVTATITGAAPTGANLATGGYPQGLTSERTATPADDFASATATCTIPATTAHNALVDCELPMVADDTLSERVEHYQVALSGAPTGVTLGAAAFHTIAASDVIGMRITAANFSATEGGAVSVTVEFSGDAATTPPAGLTEFRLLFDNGDATYRHETPGVGDASLISPTPIWARAEGLRSYTFSVPANAADTTPEADEVQTWRLRGTIVSIAWNITGGDSGDDGTFTVTFADDDPTSWTVRARGSGIQNADVNESAAAIASPTTDDTGSDHANTMYFRFTNYESLDPRGEVTLTYCLAGTATGATQAAITADSTLAHDYIYPSGYDPDSTSAAHTAYQGTCTMGRGSFTIAAGGSETYRLGITLNNDDLNEGDETITASVVNVTEAGYTTRLENPAAAYVATRTIKDNDAISVSIANAGTDADAATGFQVQEGTDATFTVTLDHAAAGEVVVRYSISGDVVAADFSDDTRSEDDGRLHIAAGQTTGTITIGLTEDADTAAEDLTVTLDATGHTAPGTIARSSTASEQSATQSVVTRPVDRTLTLTRVDSTYVTEQETKAFAENAGALYFVVASGVSDTDFTVDTVVTWTIRHATTTGTSDADFSAVTGNFTWPAAGCDPDPCRFSFNITDDTVDEPGSEGFSIELSVSDNAADGGTRFSESGTGSGALTIADNDDFTIDIRTANTSVSEGNYAVVSLTPTVSAARQVTMDYDHLGSTAESGLTLTSSSADVDATLPTTGGMAGGDFGALRTGSAGTMSGTTEGHTVTFPADSTAAQYLLIPIAADNLNEPAETFQLTTFTVGFSGQYSGGYVLPVGSADPARGSGLTFTIAASDPITASIAADSATYTEGQTARFNVTLTGASAGSAAAVTVPYEVTVGATGYTLAQLVTANSGLTAGTSSATGSITIAAGATSGAISIVLPVDSSLTSSTDDQMLTVTIPVDNAATPATNEGITVAAGGGTVARHATNNAATATVTFVDAARTLTVTGPATIAEGDSDSESPSYTVTLSGTAFPAASTTVTWTVTNVDTVDADFSAASDRSGTVTFAAADMDGATKTFTLTVAGDNLNEADETFTVQVSVADPMADGGTAYGDPVTTAIDDNDGIGVVFVRRAGQAASVAESASFTVQFAFGLTGSPRTADVTVPFTISGVDNAEFAITTPSGIAATATGGTVTLDDSNLLAVGGFITVTVTGNNLNEATRTLTLTGGTPSTAGAIDYASAATRSVGVEITDDDAITVSIARASGAMSTVEEGGTAEFTVTLAGASAGSAAAITVPYTVSSSGGYDVSGAGGSVTIPAGTTTADFTVNLPLDSDLGMSAPSQTVTVTIPAPNPSATPPVAGVSAAAGGGSVTRHATNNAATVSVTFIDAAPMLTVTGPAGVTENDAGGGANTGNYTVTLTGAAFASETMVTWAVTNVTTENDDFVAASDRGGTVTFAATDDPSSGTVAKTFNIDVAGDNVNEASEIFSVNVTAPNARTTVGTEVRTTITDNDPITYRISADAATVAEPADGMAANATNAAFTVTLSGESEGDITIPVSVTGTATSGDDYTAPAATVTVDAGDTTAALTLAIAHDDIAEAAETIIVEVGDDLATGFSKGAAAGDVARSPEASDQSATVTIGANDALSIAIARKSGETGPITEDGTTSANFTVTVTGTSAQSVSVPFTVGGTNITADDYDITAPTGIAVGASGGTLSIAAGAGQSGEITIQASDDSEAELAETLSVTLTAAASGPPAVVGPTSTGAGAISITTASATVGITDDDGVTATIAAATDASVEEGGSFSIPVTLSAAHNRDVVFSVAYSATAVTTDNDAEAADRGTATGLTITSGTSGSIMIPAAADTLNEGDETFVITVTAATTGRDGGPSIPVTVAGAGATQTLTVQDDAADAITVTITKQSPSGATVAEAGDGTAAADVTFRIALSGGTRTAVVTVPFELGGLVDGEFDITSALDSATDTTAAAAVPAASATGGVIHFTLADTTAVTRDIGVNLIDDSLNEAAEELTLTGTAVGASGLRFNGDPGGALAYAGGGGDAASISVTDDDAITYSVADAAAVTEVDAGGTNPTMSFTVSLSGLSAGPVTIPYTVTTTGTSGSDFTAPSGSVTIAANSMSEDIDITILADNLNEGAETITITLAAETAGGFSKGSAAGAVTLSTTSGDNTATGTINDDDGVTVTLTGGGDVNEGATAEVTVTLSAEATGSVTVNYTIANTASGSDNDAEAADYTNTSGGSITIVTGTSRTGTIRIGVNNDELNEGDETFEVRYTSTSLSGTVTPSGSPRTFTIKDAAADAIAVTIRKHMPDGNSVDEEGSVTFRVTLSSTGNAVRTADLVVPFAITGLDEGEYNITAPAGIPTNSTGSNLTFALAGADHDDHMDITIDLLADNLNEATETLTITGAANNAALNPLTTAGAVDYTSGGNTDSISVTDNANDAIAVTIARAGASPPASVAENAGTVNFTVTLSGGIRTSVVTVPFAVTGTNIADGDYNLSVDGTALATSATSGNVEFDLSGTPADDDSVTIAVAIQDDNLNEATETLTVTGTATHATTGLRVATGGGSIGYASTANSDRAQVQITDNDAITVTITNRDTSNEADEDATGTFRIALSGGLRTTSVTVPFTFGGTLSNAEYAITTPGGIPQTGTGSAITFGLGGTPSATDHSDIVVNLQGDSVNEATETLILTGTAAGASGLRVAAGGGAISYAASGGNTATLNVTDDDSATASIATTDADRAEGESFTATVTLSESARNTGMVTVNYTLGSTAATTDNDAEIADDLTNTSAGSITINTATTLTGNITIAADNDQLNEGDETFELRVSMSGTTLPGGVTVSGSPLVLTITDDPMDAIAVTITRTSAASVGEAGSATFRVALSSTGNAVRTADVVVPFAVSGDLVDAEFDITGPGTAPATSATTHTVTFPVAGATATDTMDITINLHGDTTNEATEELTVTGTAVGATGLRTAGAIDYTASGGNTASVQVTDDDSIAVTIAAAAANPIDEGDTAEFEVTLDHASSTAVTVNYTVTAAGATSPSYTDPGNGSITIAQGQTTGTIRVVSTMSDANTGSGTLTVALGTHSASGTIGGSGSQSVTVMFRAVARSFSVAVNSGSGKTVDRDATTTETIEVNEGDTVYFLVSLAGDAVVAGSDATVTWAATGDSDTTGAQLMFTSDNWQTAQEVTVVARADDINEGDEMVGVTLSSASGGGGLGSDITTAAASVTVPANDPITYAIDATASGTEVDPGGAAVTVAVTVTLSGATSSAWTNINVPFTVHGSSTAGSGDYSISPDNRMLTFTGTDFEEDITVTINPDNINEANETIIINLGTATTTGSGGGTLTRGTAQSTVTINDDDAIAATFSAGTAAIDEGQAHTITVNLDHASAAAVTVNYSIAQGGANNPPFTHSGGSGSSGSITIAAGQQSGDFTVTSSPTNTINTGTGTLTVSFGTVTTASGGGSAGGSGSAVLTVTFREFERFFEVEADDANTTEGDTVVFTVGFADGGSNVVSSAPATVTWALSGVQTTDYTAPSSNTGMLSFSNNNDQMVRVTLARDNLNEGAETLTLTLSAASGGGGTGTGITTASDSVTIAESDDIAYHLTGGGRVVEGDSGDTATMARYTINFNVASAAAVTLPFTLSGDATGGASSATGRDYTNPASLNLVVPAGDRTAEVAIALNPDNINEADETIVLTITTADVTVASGGGTAAVRRAGDNMRTATIDDDDDIAVTIATRASSVNEGGEVTFTVRLRDAADAADVTSDADIIVPYSFNTLRIPATDSDNGSITIAAGDSSGTFTLSIPSNADVDSGSERLTVRLGNVGPTANGRGVSRGSPNSVQVQVNFVDAARTLTVTGAATHVETDSPSMIRYSVAINGRAFTAATTVTWTVTPGTAAAADFAAVTGNFEFPTVTAFEVTVAGDNLNEAAETFTVQVSVADTDADGGTAYGSPATTTITDDDTLTATLSGGGDSVAEGADASITVTLSGATHTADVVFSYRTDTADAAGSLTIPVGTTTGTLTITATDDDLSESPETFTVDADSLTAATAGAVTIAGSQMFTITADAADDITVAVAAPSAQAITGRAAEFTVRMSGASAAGVTVVYTVALTVDGEAVAIPAANITDTVSPIAAGRTGGNIAVVVPRGVNVEESGALSVTLTGVTVASGGGTAMLSSTMSEIAATAAVSSDDPAAREARLAAPLASAAGGIGQLAARAVGARLNFTGGKVFNILGRGISSAETAAAWAASFLQTGRRPTAEEILRQSSFAFNIGGGGINLWGGGDYISAEGDHDNVAYDGNVSALHFGVDTNWNNGLLGVAVSRSSGDTDFTAAGMNSTLETAVTSVHPYLTRQFNKTKLWATVGWGVGDADVKESDAAFDSDITVATAALGITYAPADILAVRLSTFYSRAELKAAESAGRLLPKVTADSLRLDAGAELSRRFVIGVRPFLSLNYRHDSGDGDTGRAADLGGGVEWHLPATTLRFSAAKSVTADGPEEQSFNFTVHKTAGRLSINLNLTADSAGLNTAKLLSGEWRF